MQQGAVTMTREKDGNKAMRREKAEKRGGVCLERVLMLVSCCGGLQRFIECL